MKVEQPKRNRPTTRPKRRGVRESFGNHLKQTRLVLPNFRNLGLECGLIGGRKCKKMWVALNVPKIHKQENSYVITIIN